MTFAFFECVCSLTLGVILLVDCFAGVRCGAGFLGRGPRQFPYAFLELYKFVPGLQLQRYQQQQQRLGPQSL